MSKNCREGQDTGFVSEIFVSYSTLREISYTLKKLIAVDRFINRRYNNVCNKRKNIGSHYHHERIRCTKGMGFYDPKPFASDDIEEISPDEWDLKLLDDIDENPDCHKFVSQEDLLKELGITL